MQIGWYLAAFAGAAVLAWLLGWAQGVVMAYVSERISADLRNATYAHLNQLSLEFFGGRRTGDLIARLSTDTERLCSYLSDNLVDFATDVLMIRRGRRSCWCRWIRFWPWRRSVRFRSSPGLFIGRGRNCSMDFGVAAVPGRT